MAIKRLRAELALTPDFVAMFLDQARLAMLVRHPNVVTTPGVIEDAGERFLVLEYVAAASYPYGDARNAGVRACP